jgi:hypothetical protein
MTVTVGVATPVPYRPTGSTDTRLGKWRIVLAVGVGLATIVVVANILVLVKAPGAVHPPCNPGEHCITPPSPHAVSLGKEWKSTALGYSFEYPADSFVVAAEDARGVRLTASATNGAFNVEVWISGAPAQEASTADLVSERRNALSQGILGLTEDDSSAERVVAPGLGFISGVGGAYAGTVNTPQGPTVAAQVAIMAAGDGRTNAVMSIVTSGESLSADNVYVLRRLFADLIYDTFRWQ